MNKSKKELYEENQNLRRKLKLYGDFWEVDTLEECKRQLDFTHKALKFISIGLLIASAFLLGLGW